MTKTQIFGAACCLILLGACATVTRGTTNQVQIMSEPSGANVKTSFHQTCTTPCTLTVNRKDSFQVTISLAGYKDEIVNVNTRVAGEGAAGFVGNVIIGGVAGMAADAITGATLEHFPNPIEVKLARSAGGQSVPKRR
jgi:PEGA domain